MNRKTIWILMLSSELILGLILGLLFFKLLQRNEFAHDASYASSIFKYFGLHSLIFFFSVFTIGSIGANKLGLSSLIKRAVNFSLIFWVISLFIYSLTFNYFSYDLEIRYWNELIILIGICFGFNLGLSIKNLGPFEPKKKKRYIISKKWFRIHFLLMFLILTALILSNYYFDVYIILPSYVYSLVLLLLLLLFFISFFQVKDYLVEKNTYFRFVLYLLIIIWVVLIQYGVEKAQLRHLNSRKGFAALEIQQDQSYMNYHNDTIGQMHIQGEIKIKNYSSDTILCKGLVPIEDFYSHSTHNNLCPIHLIDTLNKDSNLILPAKSNYTYNFDIICPNIDSSRYKISISGRYDVIHKLVLFNNKGDSKTFESTSQSKVAKMEELKP